MKLKKLVKFTSIKWLPIFLLGGVVLLLSFGMLNLYFMHDNLGPRKLDDIILGNPTRLPVFYLDQFMFQENFKIPFSSTHTTAYLESVSFFPHDIHVIKAKAKNINNSDSIIIEYSGKKNENIAKCDGTILAPSESTQSLYFISDVGNLNCSEVKDDRIDSTVSRVIVENVDAMRILYSFPAIDASSKNNFVSADAPNFSLANLSTIKIMLLIRTSKKNEMETPAQSFTLGGSEVGPYDDNYARKIFTIVLPIKH